jgi:hypothetical protein
MASERVERDLSRTRGDGTPDPLRSSPGSPAKRATRRTSMDDIIYLVGLVVVVMAILSFFGLR